MHTLLNLLRALLTMPCRRTLVLTATILILASFVLRASHASSDIPSLPELGAQTDNNSITGISSGAFMATQFYIAHSASLAGAGIIAGGPFLCALNNSNYLPVYNAMSYCMSGKPVPLSGQFWDGRRWPNIERLLKLTQKAERQGKIDALSNLEHGKLYLFSGTEDRTVEQPVVESNVQLFEKLGVPASSINFQQSVGAGHAFITDDADDTPCPDTQPPYINNCNLDQARVILETIYGKPESQPGPGQIHAFDQTEFYPSRGANLSSLDKVGYVYIPDQCFDGGCHIHVVLHGCQQGARYIDDQFYNGAGFNELASAYNMIILYPQIRKSPNAPQNPEGCWDFWGYSSGVTGVKNGVPDFYSRRAPQIQAIEKMIERLQKNPNEDR